MFVWICAEPDINSGRGAVNSNVKKEVSFLFEWNRRLGRLFKRSSYQLLKGS
jgi:hypothetical protein